MADLVLLIWIPQIEKGILTKETNKLHLTRITHLKAIWQLHNHQNQGLSQVSTSVHFELFKNEKRNDSIKDNIINIINEQKPQTTGQLVGLIQNTTNLSEKEIINLLNQLEAEDKIHFDGIPFPSFGTYIFSFESAWYWIIITIALLTTLTVFIIPQDWFPFAYVRNVLGVIFVFLLPGYALVRAIFQKKVPIKTTSESFDNIERLILSIAMSLALTPIIGLILYYTPLGIGLTPVTLSLLILTVLFASAAMAREYNAKAATH